MAEDESQGQIESSKININAHIHMIRQIDNKI